MSQKALKLLKTLSGHSGAIYDVVSDGKFIYTSSADKFVVRWDTDQGVQDNFTVKLEHSAFNMALDAKNNQLIIGNNKGGIHCVDISSKTESRYITQHKSPIFSLTYDEKKGIIYSGDGEGYFCAWEAKSMKLLITLPLDCGKIRQIAVDESGEHIGVCGQDGKLRIFETEFYNEIRAIRVNSQGVNTAHFYGENIIVGGKDALITVWDWKANKCEKSIPAHNYAIYDLAILKDKLIMVSVSFDKTIKYWSLPNLDILGRIEQKNGGHRHTVNRIAKLSNNTIVTVSDDASIKIWGVEELG